MAQPTDFSRAVGAELKRALTLSNTSQSELAELLGTSKGWVSEVVNGKKNVSIARLEMAFSVLGYRLPVGPAVPIPPAWKRRSQKRAREGRLTA